LEPTTPCATNTPDRTPVFGQPNFSGRKAIEQGFNQVKSTRGTSSGNKIQLDTLCEGIISTQFKMAVHDPTIRLL
jgi:hypothetical protein